MLSFDTTHQLTDLLIAMEAAAHRHGGPQTPVLAAILIRPPDTGALLRAELVPVPGHAWHTQPDGTTGVLATLATALRSPAGIARLQRARLTRPDEQVLGFALTYQYHGWAGPLRCVDALDTDQRLYRVTRSSWDPQVCLSIHDDRSPDDPPTRAALTDLLHATRIPQPTHGRY